MNSWNLEGNEPRKMDLASLYACSIHDWLFHFPKYCNTGNPENHLCKSHTMIMSESLVFIHASVTDPVRSPLDGACIFINFLS